MGEVIRHRGGKPRYGVCFAPSEYVERAVASRFGNWAEALVMQNYIKKTAALPGVTDFLDVQAVLPGARPPTPLTNPKLMFDFLSAHNPGFLAKAALFHTEFMAGRTRVPDMLTHKPDRKDYYEVKPGSVTGVVAGNGKLAVLGRMMPKFSLSYVAGTHYAPGKPDDVDISGRIPRIMNALAGRIGLRKITVTFTFRRSGAPAGLVLYWVCIDLETEDEIEDDVVENIGRWYVLHIVREMKATVPVADTLPLPELTLPMPAVARYVPAGLALLQMLLRAPPSPGYALVGGPNLRAMLQFEQMERTKALLRVNIGNVLSTSLVFRDRTMLILGAIPTLTATIVLVIAGGSVVAGAAGVGVGVGAEATTVATLGTSAASTAVVLPFVARALVAPAVKELSMAAGVVCVLAFGRAASAAGLPDFTQAEAIRAVPLANILTKDAAILGDVKMADGTSGVLLGAITLPGMAGLFQPLSAHRPPA